MLSTMSPRKRVLTLFLALVGFLSTSEAASGLESNEYEFHARRMKFLRRDDIDFDSLPECARPYCNSTAALSPSRLGCIDATTTKDCFCKTAVAPLACVPSGPSSEDNCWYSVEDWFAGQCDNSVPLIPADSMPSCLHDCAINWLRGKGCRTDTRNCFCKLDGRELVTAVDQCRKSGCMKHMQPGFDTAFWREQICSQGEMEKYDEGAYRSRKKMVKNVQIVAPIFVGFIAVVLYVSTLVLCLEDEGGGGFICFFIGTCLILLVIPPIFVAI